MRGFFQRKVSGSGKIVNPRKIIYVGAVFRGKLLRAVCGAGIHIHNFKGKGREGRQTVLDMLFFVFADDT